jgi:hypothetical protein
MRSQQVIQLTEFGHDVFRRAPVQAGAIVDTDFLVGQPLDTSGEAEAAADTGEATKAVAEQRPPAAGGGGRGPALPLARSLSRVTLPCRKPVVVVGL